MMRCVEVRPILSLFLEKETGPMETLEARRHLDGCDACRNRASRLSGVMNACSALPPSSPPADLPGSVMARLRSMRDAMTSQAGGGRRAALPARWTGLSLLLGAALAILARPGAGASGPFGRSFDYLAALLGRGEAPGSSDQAAGLLLTALRLFNGGFGAEIPAGAGVNLILVLQLTATALLIGLLLALPVAALTAWFLRTEARRREIPRP